MTAEELAHKWYAYAIKQKKLELDKPTPVFIDLFDQNVLSKQRKKVIAAGGGEFLDQVADPVIKEEPLDVDDVVETDKVAVGNEAVVVKTEITDSVEE